MTHLLMSALLWAPGAETPPDFAREVRPILARACFKCHGPDERARKAKLRLDDPVAAKKVLAPGRPADSELLRRIESTDGEEQMPPPATKLTLSAEQKKILRRWIEAGAEYRPHWSFSSPRQSPLPPVKNQAWVRNPIDSFVLHRIEATGMSPAPAADRSTLIRRVYLDLIGLPPTPAEADAFLNDPAADAYDRLVDRLLASPHYGERWARRWLDLARYADTNGYEKDRQRSIWLYRDWVIRALNADLPYDRFSIDQLAGDMKPNATLDDRIATGFHRNTMLNEEGGIDPLEFRFHAMTDRVAVTGTTWLGLTLGCAQCHTHKYDPISHRDYYRFLAFLNNADEPEMEIPDATVEQRRRDLERAIEEKRSGLRERFPGGAVAADKAFDSWLGEERKSLTTWTILRPTRAVSNLPRLTLQPDGSIFVSGDITKHDVYSLTFRDLPVGTTALRLEALPDSRLPAHGPGLTYYEGPKGDFFLGELQARLDGVPLSFSAATESYANLWIGSQKSGAAKALDGDVQTGWSTFGRTGERHSAMFRLAAPITKPGEMTLTLTFGRHYAASLGRFRISTTVAPEPQVRDLPEEIEAILRRPQHSREDREALMRHFLTRAPELKAARAELDELKKKLPALPTTLVFQERPPDYPRATTIHHRGEFLQPGEAVTAELPEALARLPAARPRHRLALAQWLVSPENPLGARVAVNRQWAAFFGRGIVRTQEDFGFQGEPPSHPELLDWLAVEFMHNGWSMKRLHRLIVTSATYQQTSTVAASVRERDPENRLWARGPRVRLEAELVRDSALRAAGTLSTRVGGPSVFPPQPAGVSTEGAYGALNWQTSQGPDRVRRGLYTFTKRTAPFALFQTFDAPSGEACTARREMSNTPLQALTLLNDPSILEAMQALGRSIASTPGTDVARIRLLFRRCLTRLPESEEIALLLRFVEAQRTRSSSPEAVWVATARAVINLDEFVVRP